VQYINDPSWPADLRLDRAKSNWNEWSHRLRLICDGQGFTDWLDDTFPPPDPATEPRAHRIWTINDRSLRAFILRYISQLDYKGVCDLPTSRAVFAELRKRHEKLGPHSRMMLIKRGMEQCFRPGVPLSQTLGEIDSIVERIKATGPIDPDELKAAFIINALGEFYDQLQSNVQSLTNTASFCSDHVVQRVLQEEDLIRNREGHAAQNSSTALAAQSAGKARVRPVCSNCKRASHLADFCIQPGGKMEGRSIDDTKAAQHAASQRTAPQRSAQPTQSSAHVATTDQNKVTPAAPITINGISYTLVPNMIPAPPAVAVASDSALMAVSSATIVDADYDFHAYIAIAGEPSASVKWEVHGKQEDLGEIVATPVALSATRTPVENLDNSPFFLDTGATTHISPERSDFKSLRPISPHPISGIGGACVYAAGIGSIDLCITGGHKIKLDNVLYVPASKIRLISVLSLNRGGDYTSHFDSSHCWVTTPNGTTVLRGFVYEPRRLYGLPLTSPLVGHTKTKSPAAPDAALYATRMLNVETWHRRLGHCNFGAIIDMARRGAVEGMVIDLSSSPPKCNHCILGKQTCSPVPKVREGRKAIRPLERVYVDLCGPMPCVSRSGHLYSMNVIDDFSSYVWSLPLKSKSNAGPVLQSWLRAVENQSGHRLKILVSDNGELVSRSTHEWCSLLGIEHQKTAPYTSAHNGRAERLHRTLLDKARAMRLACNAPLNLWDEFCATSAYLTNLTASSSLQGCTPSELWFQRVPALSHLREIGCRAFALIQSHNPKLFRRSRPCVLIGYAPHSKSYRLWDPSTGQVFNSFHVSFVEHLDEQPVDLLPGTTIALKPGAPPTWEL
jgi:transposase InsO family protein